MKFSFSFSRVVILSLFVIGSLTVQAKSKILFISDVDDTIKISHVRSKADSASNAFFNYKSFLGMSKLYQLVSKAPDVNIFYVSNAPSFLMNSNHKKFLNQFNFPSVKNLRTRANPSDKQFKNNFILSLVNSESPEILVLIGDNGEHDTSIFQGIRKSLLDTPIQVFTFIHSAYSDGDGDDRSNVEPLLPEDVSFVTPIEIAIHLQLANIITFSDFSDYSNALIPAILENNKSGQSSLSFPAWKNCSNYSWNHPDIEGQPESIDTLKDYVAHQCQKYNFLAVQ